MERLLTEHQKLVTRRPHLRAGGAEASNCGVPQIRAADQIRHRAEIELPVGINLQHMREAHADGGFKTDNDGSAFALVEGLMDHLHLRGGETIAETLGGFV